MSLHNSKRGVDELARIAPTKTEGPLFARGGVVPSAAERAAAIAAFGSGGSEGRALALRNMVQSRSIYNQQYNPALVLMQYFGYLLRNPTCSGADAGLCRL